VDGFVTVDAVDRSTEDEESDLLVVVVSAAATPARRASANVDHLMMRVVVCARGGRRENGEQGQEAVLGKSKERCSPRNSTMDDVFFLSLPGEE
jgi:hypothetical protein